MATAHHTAGYMVVDTACQRSCCGLKWLAEHEKALKGFGLLPHSIPCHEKFKFGALSPQVADRLYHLPSSINKKCLILGTHPLQADIPFLGSLSTLEKLGCVLDLSKLGCEVSLCLAEGHLALKITDFPQNAAKLGVWKQLQNEGCGDPEVNILHAAAASDAQKAPGGNARPALQVAHTAHEPRGRGLSSMGIHGEAHPAPLSNHLAEPQGHGSLGHQQLRPLSEGGPGGQHGQTSQEAGEFEASGGNPRATREMRTPPLQEARQSPREFRDVPGVLTPMEMGDGEQPEQAVRGRQHAPRSKQQRERSYSRLDVAWLVLQFAAAAAFSLDHGGRIHSPALEHSGRLPHSLAAGLRIPAGPRARPRRWL